MGVGTPTQGLAGRLGRRARELMLVAGCLPVLAAAAPWDKGPVRDLYFGESLFHYFKGDDFTALYHLMAAEQKDRVPNHAEEAALLRGGLHLSYGMQDQAALVFNALLKPPVPQPVQDSAWYYLGKLAYQRGVWNRAMAAFQRSGEAQSEDERALLGGLMAIRQGQPGEALTWLEAADENNRFAQYNKAIALQRLGRLDEAVAIFEEIGEPERNPDDSALLDRINLAAGMSLLQAERPAEAVPFLNRVRLDGPQSNLALLAAGWAEAEAGNPTAALRPWRVLLSRDQSDVAVLEARLAVPYAYRQMGDLARAADEYENAVGRYDLEIAAIQAAIADVESGRLIGLLSSMVSDERTGWLWEIQQPPEGELGRYLAPLLAEHAFQEGFKNYRDLRAMSDNLDAWRQSIQAFDTMLASRRERFDRVLPRIEQKLDGTDVAALIARRDALSARLAEIRQNEDVLGLATADELRHWQDLREVRQRIASLPTSSQTLELAKKRRRLAGVLYWQIHSAYPDRQWAMTKAVRELDELLEETVQRVETLSAAPAHADNGVAGFAGRVDVLRQRVNVLGPRLNAALVAQANQLQRLALASLEDRLQRLRGYRTQARFSLAQLYDNAAIGERPAADGEAGE